MKVRYGDEAIEVEEFFHRRFDEFSDRMHSGEVSPKQQAMTYILSAFVVDTVRILLKRKVEEPHICRFISTVLDPRMSSVEPVAEDEEDREFISKATALFARLDDALKPSISYEEVMGQPLPPQKE